MLVTVRVKPHASRTKVGGSYALPQGLTALVVCVTAPPADGKATAQALSALTQSLHLRPYQVRLVSGRTSRVKIIEVPDQCRAQIETLLEQ